jgi:hypothetical protein
VTDRIAPVRADHNAALPADAVLDIRTEYSNARGFSDGDVFRHLRHYQLTGDSAQAGQYEVMSRAFDDLLPFTGLWAPLQLGCLSRILTMNCEEVKQRHLLEMRN